MSQAHDSPHAGHLGRDRTYKLLSRYYYWPGIQVDSAKYVRKCLLCQQNKSSQSGPQGLMGIREYPKPWHTIAADIMGPFTPSKNQYKYVLVIQDLFTKFVIIRPLRTATGQNIIRSLKDSVFAIFGYSKVVHTDNGTEFDNKYLDRPFEELGIQHSKNPPYHAQANPTERVNKTLETIIRTFRRERSQNVRRRLI